MKKALLVVALATSIGSIAPCATAATYVANVTIEEISVNRQLGNWVFIRVSQPATSGKPACATNAYWHYTLPLADAPGIGKNIYAALLAALGSKSVVTIGGIGACQEHFDVESLAAFNPT